MALHAGMAEWLKRRPRDLKKRRARTRQPLGVTPSWVRIPLPAPLATVEAKDFSTIYLSGLIYSFLNLFQKCCLCLAILAAFSSPASMSALSDPWVSSPDGPSDVPNADFESVEPPPVPGFTSPFSGAPPSTSFRSTLGFSASCPSPVSTRVIWNSHSVAPCDMQRTSFA